MIYFLIATFLLCHAVAGEAFLGGKDHSASRRFTYEDGEYEISTFKATWFTARTFCRVQGGKLLSIETMDESSAIFRAIGSNEYSSESFWTSGSELHQIGSFYWDSAGGALGPFTAWAIYEPQDENNDHCLSLNAHYNHLWADDHCYLNHFFICEYLPCSKSAIPTLEDNKATSTRFTFENNTYEISSTMAKWVAAKNDCKAKGMELVSIESLEENRAILRAIADKPSTHNFWTSGTDLGSVGEFYWEATGQAAAPYTNWAPGMPDNAFGAQHCLHLWGNSNFLWNDIDCEVLSYYICELTPC